MSSPFMVSNTSGWSPVMMALAAHQAQSMGMRVEGFGAFGRGVYGRPGGTSCLPSERATNAEQVNLGEPLPLAAAAVPFQ